MSYKYTLCIIYNTAFTVSIFDDKLFTSLHKCASFFEIVLPQIDCKTIGRFFLSQCTEVLLQIVISNTIIILGKKKINSTSGDCQVVNFAFTATW